ncbi:MAG: amino acid--[acyl-carrier-protein] ligase [Planctomycetia bacterium]|nr:amino acid--[acyl-carrier-protein] ligase [Planctomycetia bacterium]
MCLDDESLTAAYRQYQTELVEAGLLISLGVPGLYGRSGIFEGVIEHFEQYVTQRGAFARAEVMRFPPMMSRQHYLRTGHIQNFPDLMGSVHTFQGGDREHLKLLEAREKGEDWTRNLAATESMMVPAACYPLYPTATGTLPSVGRTVDLRCFVFRCEPSSDPARMQLFRQREYVRLGTAEQALDHRNGWLKRGQEILNAVGLDARPVVANDPFFGRGGQMLAATQVEQDLKYELVVPIATAVKPTAIASCNYHLDHFGHAFDIKTADGKPAHSACIGFGLERIALALFKTHGFDPTQWPTDVKRVLAL